MRWIRSNIRGLTRLALFALAVQLAVTFGHVHLDGLVPAPARAAAAGMPNHTGAALAKADSRGPQSHGGVDFDCPICALILMASSSAPSVAPPLPIPAKVGGTILPTRDEAAVTVSPTFAFQARGPPVV